MSPPLLPEDQARIRRTYRTLRLALLVGGVLIAAVASLVRSIREAVSGAVLVVLFFLAGLSTAEAHSLGRIDLRTRRLLNLGLGLVFIVVVVLLAPWIRQ